MNGRLQKLIEARGAIRKAGVIGMGYVGIPSAVLLADCPTVERAYGFQRDSPSSGHKIAMLNRGESPLKGEEPWLEALIKKVVDAGKFRCTSDFSLIGELDAVTLAIQTPFKDPKDLVPDFDALIEGLKMAGRHIAPGALVVLESTITPGTTLGMARDILELESGLKAGEDFALAHAPERVMVGRLLRNIQEHDRIVGGIDETSTRRAMELYGPVLTKGRIIPMSATAAEVTKTAENTFRDLQIAAVNELALYCEAMGINFYDVRAGIDSLKGEGITRAILWPGAGVGGHCLTKDTYHLERGVKILNGHLDYPAGKDSIFVLARNVNDFMPRHMFNLTVEALGRAGRDIKGARVAMLGWAFLGNSDDARNTPSEAYYEFLLKAGAVPVIHDSWVEKYPGVFIGHDLDQTLEGAHALAVMTGHDVYRSLDPAHIKALASGGTIAIIDGRNVIDPDRFIAAGFIYKGIGRGDRNSHPLPQMPRRT
jgi:UDP-N-acetyl-D-mannosaminuronic acid dehydrogenase